MNRLCAQCGINVVQNPTRQSRCYSCISKQYGPKQRSDPAYRERQCEFNRQYYLRHKDDKELKARKAKQMATYARDPLLRPKHEARWKLHRKVLSGKIKKQPCEQCGNEKSQAHHPDYSKPYDVIWLCPPCHRNEHAKVKEGK